MASNIKTEYSDRVRYFLSSRSFGTIKIDEPLGWNEDEKEFSRNKNDHGVFTTLSNSLKFIKDSKEFIELVYETEGINAELVLRKESKNNKSDLWENSYTGYLDLSTREVQDNQISLKFNSGGIESKLKAREGDDIEIERLDTIDGKIIEPLKTFNVELAGRRIFLESTWKGVPMTYYKEIKVESKAQDGNRRSKSNTFTFDVVLKSHEQAGSLFDSMDGDENNGQLNMMFLSPVDRTRKFTINIKELSFLYYGLHKGRVDWGYISVAVVKYGNGSNFDRIGQSSIDLWRHEFSSSHDIPSGNVNISPTVLDFTLNQGESLGLEVLLVADFEIDLGALGATFKRDFYYKLTSGQVTIQEDSEFRRTICKAVKPFDLANRLVEILTGRKNAVKSEILQSGKWKHLMITHGFWVRGFSTESDSELPVDNRKFKPLTTSFKDFITSLSAVCNLGFGIERVGAREYVVIEDLKYFYNRNTTVKLPFQVSKVKRTTEASMFYKSLEFGYEKGGEYEEAMGLDEYNIRNSYTTCIHRVDNKYTKLSKYRCDSYGVEFARRKPFSDYATEDTNYDQDIFFLDCKDSPTVITFPTQPLWGQNITIQSYQLRLWNDDFSQRPTGVFSPETAFNLRLTPFNLLLRHGWNISAGLNKYPMDKVKYSSSKGNSSLVTLYPENGEIANGQLERPRFEPEIIEFEHVCTDEIMGEIQGRSSILGSQLNNCYGLIEFINELGEPEKGYLMNLKPNGVGNWKLMKYIK